MSSDLCTGVLELELGEPYIGSAYSPQVEVTDTEGGHEVAITYMSPEGLKTVRFDVPDGEQGQQGPAGFSPTVSITDTPTGHTVTITDADGPHSYDVPNYAQEEQQRQDAWDALSGEVTDAIGDAQTATTAATSAAESATSAASSATGAAQAATTAATSANTAASAATSAATAANSAATAAGTAADSANAAAQDATDAASAANTAADAAQAAATEVAPKVEQLWGNQLTRELTGEVLTAADAYAAPPMALTVDGKSTQDSTTGKNLLNLERTDIIDTNAEGGAFDRTTPRDFAENQIWLGVTANGYFNPSTITTYSVTDSSVVATVGQNGYGVGFPVQVLPSTTYYVCSDNTSAFIAAGFYDASGNNLSWSNTISSGQITTPLDCQWAVIVFRPNQGVSTTFNRPCFNVSGTGDGTYEPYTGGKPSPSPDYPQEIVSVENPELTFAGKNLFDPSHLLEASGWTVSDGVYTGEIGSLYNKYGPYSKLYPISGLIGTQQSYTLSLDYVPTNASKISYIGFAYTDGTTSYTSNVMTSAGRYSFTSDGSKTLAGLYFTYANGQTVHLSNIQLELGSTATAYQPYDGTTVSLQLPQPLRSRPDGIKDTLALSYLRPSTHEGYAWYTPTLTQNIDVYTFFPDGVNIGNPADLGDGWYRYIIYGQIKNLAGNSYGLCDKTLYATSGTGEHAYIVGQAIVIQTQIATTADLRAAFAGGHLLYSCTPTTTTLDPIELPVLPAPNATVWCDPSTGLQMRYVRDTNIAYAQLEAALADLATS